MKGRTIQRLAVCHDCPWRCEAANAQGLASQHAARKQHQVGVEVLIEYSGRSANGGGRQLAIGETRGVS